MKKTLSLIALSMVAVPAMAQSISGDTTGGPTFTRSVAGFGGLSGAGVNVNYEVVPFTVTANGSYVWQNTAAGNWDSFTFIYQNAFNPATPLVNGVASNDDNPTIGLSGFTATLTAGTQYYYVVTGFDSSEFGAWTVDVTVTPGTAGGLVTFAPTPSAAALLGFGGLAAVRRRR